MTSEKLFVKYHSKYWNELVEQGWSTWEVYENNGIKIAIMIKKPE